MQVHLCSGNYTIVANGEVFLFAPYDDLTIQVDDGNGFQVKIVMKFTKAPSGERSIKTDIEDDSLVITCVNFDSAGAGMKRPAHIAYVDGKKVYFIFSSSLHRDSDGKARSIKYTIFWEK